MNRNDARDTLLATTQEAMRIYAENHPNWLRDFSAIRDARLAWINEYVMKHTTADLRASVK